MITEKVRPVRHTFFKLTFPFCFFPFYLLLFTNYSLLTTLPLHKRLHLFTADIVAELLGRRLEEIG